MIGCLVRLQACDWLFGDACDWLFGDAAGM